MDIAVVGGDARFAYLTRLLCSCGHDARAIHPAECGVPNLPESTLEELDTARNVVMNWPLPDGAEALNRLKPGARVFFCGPGSPADVLEGIKAVDLWKDERLLLENAWMTAEGAICAVMQAGVRSLKDCGCMVIGWGRIGRALTEMLVGLNARTIVASRSERGRNSAAERGAEGVSTYEIGDALRGVQILFSTPPQRVLGREALLRADKDALIVDLSSPPHGVDLEAAREIGLRAWREPGLPGRYCPYSAATALMQAMIRSERKGLA